MKLLVSVLVALLLWGPCLAQSKWQLQIGATTGTGWLEGKGELSTVKFDKNFMKPSLAFGVSFNINNRFFLASNLHLQPFVTQYTISSVDILNRPVNLRYRYSALLMPFDLRLNYLCFAKTSTAIYAGGFVSPVHAAKWRLLNLSDFDVPTFAPDYGEFYLRKWNYGWQAGIVQPLMRRKLSRIDLTITYMQGLSNLNQNKTNGINTHTLNFSLRWDVNLQKR